MRRACRPSPLAGEGSRERGAVHALRGAMTLRPRCACSRTHARFAHGTVSQAPCLSRPDRAVPTGHPWPDGTGFPRGLPSASHRDSLGVVGIHASPAALRRLMPLRAAMLGAAEGNPVNQKQSGVARRMLLSAAKRITEQRERRGSFHSPHPTGLRFCFAPLSPSLHQAEHRSV
jgi:hypothetical protein